MDIDRIAAGESRDEMATTESLSHDVISRDLERVMNLRPRRVTDAQLRIYERYVAEIFAACGLDLDTAATERTPQRFVRALFDITDGYEGDPKMVTTFATECRGDP